MAWSRFYGQIKGRAKTIATRTGTPESGLRVSVDAASCGITIYASAPTKNSNEFEIYLTGGSHGKRVRHEQLIARITVDDDGEISAVEMSEPRDLK